MNTEERRRKRAAYERRRLKRKRQRTKQIIARMLLASTMVLVLFFAVKFVRMITKTTTKEVGEKKTEEVMAKVLTRKVENAPDFEVQLLTPNQYSRPEISMERVKGIVIHYTANPGTSAQQNRDYFEGLKDTGKVKASSHFVVGLEGEIIQCIPSTEISYANTERNGDTITIENCHPDKTGKFTSETYKSLVHLTAWLCGKFDLTVDDVIRHYDVTGKECPLYYVEHEDEWEAFKQDVRDYINKNGTEKEVNLG